MYFAVLAIYRFNNGHPEVERTDVFQLLSRGKSSGSLCKLAHNALEVEVINKNKGVTSGSPFISTIRSMNE